MNFNKMIWISRFEIPTAYNCMICFQNSGNVENEHLNWWQEYFSQYEIIFAIFWSMQAFWHKACTEYAIFDV